jgi:DNA-binding CsgD family transcriptional regulator
MQHLTEAIYDAAVDPGQWTQVMRHIKRNFATGAETFYYLDLNKDAMKPVHVDGISQFYLQAFEDRYFTPGNPCLSCEPLHRPGTIRSDALMAAYFRDPQIRRRSEYFNDWMRPQDLHHTMGTTLLDECGVILNLTLLRSEKVGGFASPELRAFERLCIHVRRAFRIAMRLGAVTAREQVTLAALDALPYAIALLDPAGRLLCANAAGERLLRDGRGLTVQGGRLVARNSAAQQRLGAFLRRLADPEDTGAGPDFIAIDRQEGAGSLVLRGVRLSAGRYTFASEQPTVMLLISDPAASPPAPAAALRRRYGLTAAEARLAEALLAGGRLREAAETVGMSYETARWYLKILFQKTETNRQATLVARLLKDTSALLVAPPSPAPRRNARRRR